MAYLANVYFVERLASCRLFGVDVDGPRLCIKAVSWLSQGQNLLRQAPLQGDI